MKKYCLEIATFTLDGAIKAQGAGADRIELCENPHDGGTTPSFGMLTKVMEVISIPVFPIIRPRGGDFVYSDQEFEIMQHDIQLCKKMGYQGVVIGLLTAKGNIDIDRTSSLVQLASPMQVTFHRAFDRSANPLHALEDIIKSGCHRILTSGQFPSIMNGIELVRTLVQQANKRIVIMPGSGLNQTNIEEIVRVSGANEFHTAARTLFRQDGISSPSTMNESMSFVSVDENEVKQIRLKLDNLFE